LDERAIELGELLLVQQPPAGIDDIVPGLEVHHGALGGRGLRAQLLEAILQPQGGATRGLVFGFQRIDDIGIGNRIGDLCRALRTEGLIADVDHIGQTDALDGQARFKPFQSTPSKLEIRPRLVGSEKVGDKPHCRADEATTRPDEFRILSQAKVLDDRQGDVLRFQYLHLAVHHRRVDANITQDRLLLEQLNLARVDDEGRLTREPRRGSENVYGAERRGQQQHEHDDRELPTRERNGPRV